MPPRFRLILSINQRVPILYFLYITNALFSSFILSTDRLSRVIKRDEPKGSLPLAYFISASLIVYSVCAPVFKEPRSTLYPTCYNL
jgi:hypothetical protein